MLERETRLARIRAALRRLWLIDWIACLFFMAMMGTAAAHENWFALLGWLAACAFYMFNFWGGTLDPTRRAVRSTRCTSLEASAPFFSKRLKAESRKQKIIMMAVKHFAVRTAVGWQVMREIEDEGKVLPFPAYEAGVWPTEQGAQRAAQDADDAWTLFCDEVANRPMAFAA